MYYYFLHLKGVDKVETINQRIETMVTRNPKGAETGKIK